MKVKVAVPQEPEFNPITLTITIESLRELASLYARFNVGQPTGGYGLMEYGKDYGLMIKELADGYSAEELYAAIRPHLVYYLQRQRGAADAYRL